MNNKIAKEIVLPYINRQPFVSGKVYNAQDALFHAAILAYIDENDADGLESFLAKYKSLPVINGGEILTDAIIKQGGCAQCPVITQECYCKSPNDAVIVVLLEDGRFDPTFRNGLPLLLAVRQNNSQLVDTLLDDDRVDPAANDNAARKLAAKLGHENILQRLVDDVRTHYILE